MQKNGKHIDDSLPGEYLHDPVSHEKDLQRAFYAGAEATLGIYEEGVSLFLVQAEIDHFRSHK